MKLVDDLYNMYKDHLVGDEEDAAIIVSGVLEELTREHFMEWIKKMSEEELYQMLGTYLIDQLKIKMDREGLGHHDGEGRQSGDVH